MGQLPKPGEIYRHFKGNCYRIITVATHTETGEKLVVYQALYGDYGIYARELAMFSSPVDRGKYPNAVQKMRFELLPSGAARPVVPKEGSAARQTVQGAGAAERPVASGAAQAGQGAAGVTGKRPESGPAPAIARGEGTRKAEFSGQGKAPEKEAEPKIDPMVLAFLDANTCKEKLHILTGMKERLTDAMINTMAISVDVEIKSGDITERYEALKYCLATKERFECRRLR